MKQRWVVVVVWDKPYDVDVYGIFDTKEKAEKIRTIHTSEEKMFLLDDDMIYSASVMIDTFKE